jgi:muramidase (phage lysozyme)
MAAVFRLFRLAGLLCLALFGPAPVLAEPGASLFAAALAGAPARPLIAAPGAARPGGLLAGREAGNLFSFRPRAQTVALAVVRAPAGAGRLARLRDLIAAAEAGPAGYDAVQHGARVRPARAPTEMTLDEIFAWIAETPGQPHAIGRYQVIPKTLRHLVARLDLPGHARYSPDVQDLMADQLMREAGLDRFLAGEIGRHAFMNALTRVWAGLPTDSGKSHYHGYAGNAATMSWAAFDAEMARIFPG